MQHRRRGVAELNAELAVVLLQVPHPEQAPGKVEAAQLAVAVDDPDALAVGDRRRRSHVLLVADAVSAPHRLLPANGSGLAVERDQIEPVARVVAPAEQPRVRPVQVGAFFRRSDEDGIAPDDRRRRRPTGQGRAPDYIFRRAPANRKAGRIARAVAMGAAPLRPVVARRGRRGRDCERRENERQPLHKGHGIRRTFVGAVAAHSPASDSFFARNRGDQSANASIKSPVACNRDSFALANA